MTKNYINGSDRFSFRIISPNGKVETLNFSFRFKALTEFDQAFSIRHQLSTGEVIKKIKYFRYEWTIDFSEYMNRSDSFNIQKIKNAEFENKKIFLTPHFDVPWREYQVHVIDEKRALGIHYKQVNKDYIINFESVQSFEFYDWYDPNIIPVSFAEIFFEF